MLNLTKECFIDRVENAAAAAQTAVDTDVIDMAEKDGVTFVALLGDVTDTCVLTLTVQHGDLANGSDMASTTVAATFTAGASDADNKLLVAECFRPIKRYVRARLTRTTANAVVDGILALVYDASQAPVTQPADVLATAYGLSPESA